MTADVIIKGELPEHDGKYFFSKYSPEEKHVIPINPKKEFIRRSSLMTMDNEALKTNTNVTETQSDIATTNQIKDDSSLNKTKGTLTCSFCGKNFYTKWTLKRHVMSHTGEKPHPCDICSKSFASKWQLELHYRIHTGEKPYPCDVCSKRFTTKSHLSRHKRTHSNKKKRPASNEAVSCVRQMSELTLNDSSKKRFERSCDSAQKQSPPEITKLRLRHTKSDPGAHTCTFCRKQFSTLSKLKLHQHILHPRVLFVYGLTHVIYI